MAKMGKRYKGLLEKVEATKLYGFREAVFW
jgi:hypothetical protein